MPSFGAIKQLQARCPGVPRSVAKKALEDHGDDEDAAAAHIASTTEFKDSKAEHALNAHAGGRNQFQHRRVDDPHGGRRC